MVTSKEGERKMRTLRVGIVFVLLSNLVACGGDSSAPPCDDGTAPTVTSTSPADGAAAVALNTSISATFSEPMDPATITGASFALSQGTTRVAGVVTYVGVTATFNPAANLDADTTYTATIVNTATDLADNKMVEDYVWTFTTGTTADVTPPQVSSTTPANEATDVALNAPLSATFSEAMDPLTISTVTFTLLDGTVPVAGTVSYSGVTATFHPVASLDGDTTYTATIVSLAADLAGNKLAEDYVWSFSTGTAPDATRPQVSSTSPANGALDVALDATIVAIFSEAMDPATISTATFALRDGTVPVAGTVTYSGVTATFHPAVSLDGDITYTATISRAAADPAGNTMAEDYVWSFTTGAAPDTIAPQVSSTVPANEETGVAVNAPVAAVFSEAMDPATISTATFTLLNGTTLVAGAVTYVGVTATFRPTVGLDGDTTYTATINQAAADPAGNTMVEDYVWTFTTGTAPDTIAPQVSSTVPANEEAGVAVNTPVAATFSEPMDPLTISTATFTLLNGTTPVAGAVTYVGVTATFRPTVGLDGDTTYTATIIPSAADLAGNAMVADYVWSFTTGTAPDVIAPNVSSTIPANAETDVAVNAPIAAIFSEPMDPLTISTATFTLFAGTTPVAGAVTYVGVTATFTPTVALDGHTTYTARIGSIVTDLAGNGMVDDYVWIFVTGTVPDTTPPQVSSTIPAPGATGVALNAPVAAIFSEAMDPLTISTANFTLLRGTTPVAGAVTYVGVTATFTPTAVLEPVTTYTATMTTAVRDLAGNRMAANHVWTFTTGAAPDTIRPQVSSTIPANTATGVAVNAPIAAIFSEAMDPLTISTATFTLLNGTTPVAGAVTYVGVTATFRPTVSLAALTTFTATITSAAQDIAHNSLLVNYVWTFTTGVAPDTTPPQVSSTIPANGATGVAVNYPIVAIFTEAMDPLTISTATFTLLNGTMPIAGAVSYVGVTATFTPTSPLQHLALFTATVTTAVRDVAGNRMAANYVWTFYTGAAPDTTRPQVISTVPANGVTGVAVNAPIAATFSEAMDPLTISTATFTLAAGTTPVAGAVTYVGVTATLTPTSALAAFTTFTATITTAVRDVAGNRLLVNYVWTFTTGAAPDTTRPTVLSTNPANGATGTSITAPVAATFSEAMDPLTISTATFTLFAGTIPVAGAVTYSLGTATFRPTSALTPLTLYTATITTAAQDIAHNGLAANYVWRFTTGAASGLGVNLGTAGGFVILAKSGIDTVPTSAVTGNIGVSPAAATYITGFSLTMDSSNVYSTSSQVIGNVYAADYTPPTPSNMTTAVSDMELAFTDAAGRAPGVTELGAGSIGGRTLAAGVYKWSSGLLIATDVTLTGSATDVWILQIAENLTVSSGVRITLAGGALAKNIFWQVSGAVSLGTTAHFEGVVLCQTEINLLDSASINGRLLAQTAVNIIHSTVVQPAP
jgi:hypothetical protein